VTVGRSIDVEKVDDKKVAGDFENAQLIKIGIMIA